MWYLLCGAQEVNSYQKEADFWWLSWIRRGWVWIFFVKMYISIKLVSNLSTEPIKLLVAVQMYSWKQVVEKWSLKILTNPIIMIFLQVLSNKNFIEMKWSRNWLPSSILLFITVLVSINSTFKEPNFHIYPLRPFVLSETQWCYFTPVSESLT